MKVRGWCSAHEQVLDVEGTIVFPTDGLPEPDENGWMELDQSGMYCAKDLDDGTESCKLFWEWQLTAK
jgi:hypothetical protein